MSNRQIKYFSAIWCGPCKMFKPVMQEIKSEGFNIEFIDVDENQELAAKYGVRSVPTCIVEENGKEITRFSGTASKGDVKRHLL